MRQVNSGSVSMTWATSFTKQLEEKSLAGAYYGACGGESRVGMDNWWTARKVTTWDFG